MPGSKNKYLALFNVSPAPAPRGRRGGLRANAAAAAPNGPAADATEPRSVSVSLSDLGYSGPVKVRDLWNHKDLGTATGAFAREINSHGAGLYLLQPQD